MYKIQTFNKISKKGLDLFDHDLYEVASEMIHPDAILLRSHKLDPDKVLESVKCIARAGAGVNNIPVTEMTERGVVVFNSPGANANAVRELVIAGLLLGSRGIVDGINYVKTLTDFEDSEKLNTLLEKEKARFAGHEIKGKALGVIGLGAIGAKVAHMGLSLGMEVYGYDPVISVDAAWKLSHHVQRVEHLSALLAKSDYITLHLAAVEATRNLINVDNLALIKDGVCLLNFARGEIVDSKAVIESLDNGKLRKYITDFPTPDLIKRDDVILTPHIGASTREAEENCTIMATEQLKDFLVNGNINNSVNFPTLYLERSSGNRLTISNRNIPKMLGNVLSVLANENINIIDMLNKSRQEVAYNIIDIETKPADTVLDQIKAIDGVLSVRLL